MIEFTTLFIAGYVTSSIFLLPLLGIYLFMNFRKVDLGLLGGFHKAILLGTIVLPAALLLISYTGDAEISPTIPKDSIQAQIVKNINIPQAGDLDNGSYIVTDNVSAGFPVIQDAVFYFIDLFMFSFIAGLVLFIIRYAVQAARLSVIRKNSKVTKITNDCELVESERVKLPFSLGVFRKRIFIPANMPGLEKKVVIRHEVNHTRCNHHFWSFLELMLTHIFWFNPIMYILKKRGSFLRELECDSLTTQKVNRFEYTRLLLKTAESMSVINGPGFTFITQGWAKKEELKMRIERLLSGENRKKKVAISLLLAVGIIFSGGLGLFYGNLSYGWEDELVKIRAHYQKKIPESSRVEIEKVPGSLINALLVGQDSRFYEHDGLDKRSVFRAAGVNIKSWVSGGGFALQGGSSITQQLAKQFLYSHKRSLKRKIKELRVARILEKNFSKDEILEMYLNMAYFGEGNRGLKAASEFYFKHDYTQLTLNESAMLVPFLDAPNKYNFIKDPVTAEKRQQRLLKRIAESMKT